MDVPQELMSRYIERRKRDLESCLNSLQDRNYAELEKVGHQLKGNGVTFGHLELSEIGSSLELAAQDRNTHELEKALMDFSRWVNSHLLN